MSVASHYVMNPAAQPIGHLYIRRTDAETSAGVTPTNYQYPEGNVKRYGAAGDGTTDDISALDNALLVASQGVPIIMPPGDYGISSPWNWGTNGKISLICDGLRGENAGNVTLKKLSAFSGSAALIIGDNSATVNGILLERLYVDGNNQSGAGILAQKISVLTLADVVVEDNDGWGIIYDGIWIGKCYNVDTRQNGDDGVGGGGTLWRSTNRQNSNCAEYACHTSGNYEYQYKHEADASDSSLRTASHRAIDCLWENPANDSPVAYIAACRSFDIISSTATQVASNAEPTLTIGEAAAAATIEGLKIFGGRWNHSNTASDAAYVVATDIGDMEIISAWSNVNSTNSKFLDADSCTSGVIVVNGGNIEPDEIADTNGVVVINGGAYVQLGKRAGTAGNDITISGIENEKNVRIIVKDSGGSEQLFNIGAGTDYKLVDFDDMSMRIIEKAAEPSTTYAGMIVRADRSTWDPLGLGSGGSYLVQRNDANSAWVAIDAQGA